VLEAFIKRVCFSTVERAIVRQENGGQTTMGFPDKCPHCRSTKVILRSEGIIDTDRRGKQVNSDTVRPLEYWCQRCGEDFKEGLE